MENFPKNENALDQNMLRAFIFHGPRSRNVLTWFVHHQKQQFII